ncbi:hypothetical protein BH10CYA1_BH10CYA1_32660 [soil metagenome]
MALENRQSSLETTPNNVELYNPELAQLLSRPSKVENKQRTTRSEEIEAILNHQSSEPLATKEKQAMGKWLQSHFERMEEKSFMPFPGLSEADLIERYSSAQWTDNSKMLWSDMRMLKTVAAHFNEIALGGRSASIIEPEDVSDLEKGATIKRTKYDVTSTYPDGGLHRITKDGTDYTLNADGSMILHSKTIDMNLNSDGAGCVESTKKSEFPFKIPLKRGADEIWRGKTEDGEDFELAVDAHSISLKNGDVDMLLTSKGGYIRDPEIGTNMIIHPDSSVTMDTTDEGSANIGVGPDGTVLAISDVGSREIIYPFGVMVKKTAKGEVLITGGGPFKLPRVKVASDGSFELSEENGDKTESSKVSNGTFSATLPDGRLVTRKPDNSIIFTLPIDGDHLQMTFGSDDTATFEVSGRQSISYAPLPLKAPVRLVK